MAEERTLVEAALSGDENAFGRLAAKYRPELQLHCYRMLGSFHDSEDMVQETLLRAWRRRDGFQGRSTFRAWLYKIATNVCLDLLSRRTRRPVTVLGQDLPEGAQVLLLLGAANRDEAVFADPDEFDVTRENARDHLSFGHGTHFCIGSQLARMEMRIAFEELMSRFPGMRLDRSVPIGYLPNISAHAPTVVPVRWDAA